MRKRRVESGRRSQHGKPHEQGNTREASGVVIFAHISVYVSEIAEHEQSMHENNDRTMGQNMTPAPDIYVKLIVLQGLVLMLVPRTFVRQMTRSLGEMPSFISSVIIQSLPFRSVVSSLNSWNIIVADCLIRLGELRLLQLSSTNDEDYTDLSPLIYTQIVSFLAACFMLVNCLRKGKGKGISLMVGLLAFVHVLWIPISSTTLFFLGTTKCYSCGLSRERCHEKKCFWMNVVALCLWMARMVWVIGMSLVSLNGLRIALSYLSTPDMESNELRTSIRMSRTMWMSIIWSVIFIPPCLVAIAALMEEEQLYILLWEMIAIICLDLFMLAANIIFTRKLSEVQKRRHRSYQIIATKLPRLRAFAFLVSTVIAWTPAFVLPFHSNHSTQQIFFHTISYIAMLDCIVYVVVTPSVREHYSQMGLGRVVVDLFLSPLLLPFEAGRWISAVKRRRGRENKSFVSPLLEEKRPQSAPTVAWWFTAISVVAVSSLDRQGPQNDPQIFRIRVIVPCETVI
ncbi:hypothetical protein PROFUN_07038 [Planoprotostelium fungivorum]|uniref:Uncharacterized protein n=1 Tax=Planoprotostelium fungivorum TaxID=1890364 RepID=A0A2P6NN05_9EUKA|nr:hypothetical protein PROFUN_07038 [Planoprotostelium fungivorum]